MCNCHLRWLNAYLREKKIETSGVRCVGPRHMAKRKFGVFSDRRFRCRSKDSYSFEKKQCILFFPLDRKEYLQTSYSIRCAIRCPKGCICHRTTVICRGLQLKEIPKDIPIFTTAL